MIKPDAILFATAEVAPYAKVGGLADVSAALPRELSKRGIDMTVMSPLYGMVRDHCPTLRATSISGKINLGNRLLPYRIYEHIDQGVRLWFVANDELYNRSGIYAAASGTAFADNTARYFFFQYVILDLLHRQFIAPDVLHINDHHTGLLPLMLQNRDIACPVLLTIHNAMYQGHFSASERLLLQTPETDYFRNHDRNTLKTGIRYSHHVVTVSPTYRDELLSDAELAYGLQDELARKGEAFSGILNGADYTYWNPETDPHIVQPYSLETLASKKRNKLALREAFHLTGSDRTPLFGSVSRQVESKGFHLILAVLDELVADGVSFVFLGTGEPEIMAALQEKSRQYPTAVACVAAYNEPLAHQIEAASDFFLMPSRYEPCGLNQIYSLRYGTIPIVHQTGGLADTVINWDGEEGNGFSFPSYDAQSFLQAIHRALRVYGTKDWNALRRNAMLCDYSWQKSAEKYRLLYTAMRNQHE